MKNVDWLVSKGGKEVKNTRQCLKMVKYEVKCDIVKNHRPKENMRNVS